MRTIIYCISLFSKILCLSLALAISSDLSAKRKVADIIDSLHTELSTYKDKCDSRCLDDSGKVRLLIQLASAYDRIDLDSAMKFSTLALDISKEINWRYGIGKAYMYLGDAYDVSSDFSACIKCYEKSIGIWLEIQKNPLEYEQYNPDIHIAAVYNRMGIIFSRTGDKIKTMDNYHKALALYEELGDKKNQVKTWINIGTEYVTVESYDKALQYLLRALKIAEEDKSPDVLLDVYQALGNLLLSKLDNRGAIKYFKLALDLCKELNQEHTAAICHYNLGNAYYELDSIPASIKYTKESIRIFEIFSDDFGLSVGYQSLGLENTKAGDYEESLKNYNTAFHYASALGFEENIIRTQVGMGETFIRQKKYADALEHLVNASELSTSTNKLSLIILANEKLGELYNLQGEFKKAYIILQAASIAKDSLHKDIEEARTTVTLSDYEHERNRLLMEAEREKSDALQKAENQRQVWIRNIILIGTVLILCGALLGFFFYKKRRDAIEKQKETQRSLEKSTTEMKALRSQMNPHFIFNALQSIQSFLVGNKASDASEHLVKFSKLMRLILENSKYQEVKLTEDLHALEIYMQLERIRLKDPFTYAINVTPDVNPEEEIIPPLILQPFVENAIWHGLQYKTGAGHIEISILKRHSELLYIVEDNGIGRSAVKEIPQFFIEKKESMGMQLTIERLRIHNELNGVKAHFQVIDLFDTKNNPAGTRVELSLPAIT